MRSGFVALSCYSVPAYPTLYLVRPFALSSQLGLEENFPKKMLTPLRASSYKLLRLTTILEKKSQNFLNGLLRFSLSSAGARTARLDNLTNNPGHWPMLHS